MRRRSPLSPANIRYALIIAALFAVLLSAFQVERPSGCADEEAPCAAGQAWHPFPASRLLLELRARPRPDP